MRQKRAELHTEMEALLALADKEDRNFTEEEEEKWSKLSEERDSLKDEIAKAEKREERRAAIDAEGEELKKSATPGGEVRTAPKVSVHNNELDKEFRNFGDFVQSIYRAGHGDIDVRVQQMKNGTSGGFLIPDKFVNEILAVEPEDAVVASRARNLSNSIPPDAEVRIPALDQAGSSGNDYGGMVIYHQGESDTLTESNAAFRQITLKPHKLTGYTTASNEVLANAIGFSGFLQGLIRGAMTDATETDYISGDGVNKALGFLNANARIDIERTTANQIAYADILSMLARRLLRGGGNWVWLASQSIIPQLGTIGDGTNNIFVTNAAAAMPQSLMGLPIIFNDRMPGLGSRGDLCLVDLSKYIIANGSGPSLMLSEHARFQNDETAIRLTFRTDGQLWLNDAITPKGSTDTRSPILVLK
jgi:HK97 family phage major capsid protein